MRSGRGTVTSTATESWQSVVRSFNNVVSQLIELAPNVVFAILVLVVGYIVARLVAKAVTAVSEKLGFQRAAESGGFVKSMHNVGIDRSVPNIIGTIFFWLLMCVFVFAAFEILGVPGVTGAIEGVTAYVPKLVVASIVVVLGLLLAAFLKGVVATSADRVGLTYANQLANACYWVLAAMTFLAAFDHLKIQFVLLNTIIQIVVAGAALAFGLSFGLGGRDVMSGILAGYYVRQRLQAGDHVTVCGYEGTVRDIGPVATIIETEEDGLISRHSIPNSKMLNEAVR